MNPEPLVQIRDLCHFRQDAPKPEPVLGPISITVASGEFVSLLGPVSCGKTSLLKLIAGILPVVRGEITVSDACLPGQCGIGLVPERPALLPWRTSMDNILLQAEIDGLDMEESRRRARRLLAWFGLSSLEERRPHDLPPGAAPAVAICRAMAQNPALLLLDDPFRQLAPLMLETMLDGFQRLWMESCTTAILCTGNIQEAVLLSDRIAVLTASPGRILEVLAIDLPRPRRLDKAMTPQIVEYSNRIRTLFRSQGILP
jgi:NitT/TauT family transport system ATP-binding protein